MRYICLILIGVPLLIVSADEKDNKEQALVHLAGLLVNFSGTDKQEQIPELLEDIQGAIYFDASFNDVFFNPQRKNKCGRTLFDYAIEHGYWDIAVKLFHVDTDLRSDPEKKGRHLLHFLVEHD